MAWRSLQRINRALPLSGLTPPRYPRLPGDPRRVTCATLVAIMTIVNARKRDAVNITLIKLGAPIQSRRADEYDAHQKA